MPRLRKCIYEIDPAHVENRIVSAEKAMWRVVVDTAQKTSQSIIDFVYAFEHRALLELN